MTILNCMMIGGGAGWLTRVAFGDIQRASGSAAVGVVGALLGLATVTSYELNTTASSYLAAAAGSGALLALWTIAQRLFVDSPGAGPR